jgi:hypothetical protein
MQPTQFELQIEDFVTIDDSWENQDSFWCAFREGYFRNISTGNCAFWENDWWTIGKVTKNQYGSYDLISSFGSKMYKTESEAFKAIENQ